MSYNGSGTFNINSAGQPVVTGTVISSTAFNALTADLGTGLSTALTKDGQTVATARIPFAAGINSSLVTDATNTTTGSIITAGGVGVAKAVFVGTTLNVAGASTLAGITGSFNGTVGATTPAAGAFTTLSATGTSTLAAVNSSAASRFDSNLAVGGTPVQTTRLSVKQSGTTLLTGMSVEASATDSLLVLYSDGTNFNIRSDYNATGIYQPIKLWTSGAVAMTIGAGGASAPVTIPGTLGVTGDATFSTTNLVISVGTYAATTGNAANMQVDSAGVFRRSTSSLQFKDNLSDLTLDEAKKITLGLHSFSYTSKSKADHADTRFIGYGAEEIAEIDKRFVSFDLGGKPDGVAYERFVVPHGLILSDHESRLASFETRLAALESK